MVWPSPPTVVIKPQMPPRRRGEPRPVSEPSSDSASAKPMLMPAPIEAARPTRKVCQLLCVAKAAANSGASVDTEPSMSPARPRLHILQDEHAPCGFVFLLFDVRSQEFIRKLRRQTLVLLLGEGQIAQKLANIDIRGLLSGALIKALCLVFHSLGLLADGVERQVPREPDRPPPDEAFHVFPANRRKVGAKALLIEVEKPVAMALLLLGHLDKNLRRRRVALLQILCEGHVNAGVFLLCGDRDSKNLALGQVCKSLRRVPQSGKHG